MHTTSLLRLETEHVETSVVGLSGQLHTLIRRAPESLLDIIARTLAVWRVQLDLFTSKKPTFNLL
jgi:hypothetical protein